MLIEDKKKILKSQINLILRNKKKILEFFLPPQIGNFIL